MLKIDKISKKYDGKQVLDEVSFAVETGKVCALLGLNGAGKSTLMKILCGLAFADSGGAALNGRSLFLSRDLRGSIGFMIESPAFYRELSGKQNLTALAMLYDGLPKYRPDEVLALVGMAAQADVPVKKYSLGMKQRLYLAYAILNDPQLLVLDEPFSGIDPVSINLFKKLILELAAGGCTVLISGHVITELQSVSDAAVIIDRGKVVYRADDIAGKDLTNVFLSLVSGDGDAQ
jgi:ABC-2 type transport system ATP-binding protein